MNEIVIDFADPGSITIEFLAKVPGPELTLGQSTMVFSHSESFARANALEGYERLILLAMSGDQALFTRSDGIERLWEVSAPLLENPPPVEPYPRGSWRPESVTKPIAPDLMKDGHRRDRATRPDTQLSRRETLRQEALVR
jgi:glucose-6-phosphate 1-dehydrogenase